MEGVDENEILKSMHMYFEEQKRNLETYPSIVREESEIYATIDVGRSSSIVASAAPAAVINYGFTERKERNSVRLPGIDKSIDQKQLLNMGECIYSDESSRRSKKSK